MGEEDKKRLIQIIEVAPGGRATITADNITFEIFGVLAKPGNNGGGVNVTTFEAPEESEAPCNPDLN